MRNLRVELTDQPGSVVGPLLRRYAGLARGETSAAEVMSWLQDHLVDSTGHRPGVTLGSFRSATERAWDSLRPTAAEERANLRSGGAAGRQKRRRTRHAGGEGTTSRRRA